MDLRSRNSSCEIKRNIFNGESSFGIKEEQRIEINWKIREKKQRGENEGKKDGRVENLIKRK